MINLNSIVQSAQGGQAVDNLASRFGITPAQAQNAVDALLPAFQMGLQKKLGGGGIGSILNHLGSDAHQQAYTETTTVPAGHAVQQGGAVLGDLFGGHGTTTQVAQQASAESGVSAAVIQAMLPMLASLIMGGLARSMQSGGLGGMLSQVIGAAMGGQGGGSIFGQSGGAPSTGSPAPQEGGIGGMIGSVLGGLFGGSGTQPMAPAPSAMPDGEPAPTGSSAQALDELSRMFQSGAPASPEHEAHLANILGR